MGLEQKLCPRYCDETKRCESKHALLTLNPIEQTMWRSLRLEWNQIGAANAPAFSIFCDALADNKALIELDLRNNEITHVGASELASALKRNTTLRALGERTAPRRTSKNSMPRSEMEQCWTDRKS